MSDRKPRQAGKSERFARCGIARLPCLEEKEARFTKQHTQYSPVGVLAPAKVCKREPAWKGNMYKLHKYSPFGVLGLSLSPSYYGILRRNKSYYRLASLPDQLLVKLPVLARSRSVNAETHGPDGSVALRRGGEHFRCPSRLPPCPTVIHK